MVEDSKKEKTITLKPRTAFLKRIDVDKNKFKIPIYSRIYTTSNKYYFKDGVCQKLSESQKTQEEPQNQGELSEVHK